MQTAGCGEGHVHSTCSLVEAGRRCEQLSGAASGCKTGMRTAARADEQAQTGGTGRICSHCPYPSSREATLVPQGPDENEQQDEAHNATHHPNGGGMGVFVCIVQTGPQCVAAGVELHLHIVLRSAAYCLGLLRQSAQGTAETCAAAAQQAG